jgi:hypothetical protein
MPVRSRAIDRIAPHHRPNHLCEQVGGISDIFAPHAPRRYNDVVEVGLLTEPCPEAILSLTFPVA